MRSLSLGALAVSITLLAPRAGLAATSYRAQLIAQSGGQVDAGGALSLIARSGSRTDAGTIRLIYAIAGPNNRGQIALAGEVDTPQGKREAVLLLTPVAP